MLELLRLDHYSADVLLFLMFGVVVAGIVVGYVTDAVMKDRGFGPVGNGVLMVFGALVGVYIRNAYFGRMEPGDMMTTGFFAAVAATLLLLVLGVAKHWVQD